MLDTPAPPLDRARCAQANTILGELRLTHEAMQACFAELERVLAQPAFNAGALTSVRLKLAGMRLTRGPLITRVANLLAGQVTDAEAGIMDELRSSHHRLLQVATAHTGKWTLDAISQDWEKYRRETRDLVRKWVKKAESEQRLVYPLVERCAGKSV